MRGDGGHAEAGAEVEGLRAGQRVGQADDPVPVNHAVLGGRAERQPVLAEVHPDPVAGRQAWHALAERVDDARAVLARGHLGERHGRGTPARAFQSVGFTPARTSRTRTCPGPGSGTGRSASRMHAGGTLLRIDDRAHTPDARAEVRSPPGQGRRLC